MLQDAQNQLWAATDGGLSRFDEDTQTFLNYQVASNTLESQAVLSLYEDEQHYLWVGTENGLSRSKHSLDRASPLSFVTYRPVDAPFHRTNTIRQIVPHPDGSLWLATDRGVVRAGLTADEVSFQVYLNEPKHSDVTGAHPIVAVYHDSQGTAWAHLSSRQTGAV